MYLDINRDIQLFYNDWGQGEPIILIHGWPLNSQMWEYQARRLAKSHRVISYDRRGFGKSSWPYEGYDYDTMADDLAALIKKLDLKNVTLVGFSMGGGEVARYFTRHGSARIARAILISSVVPYMLKTPDNPKGVDESVLDEMIQGLQDDRPSFLAKFRKQFYGVNVLSHTVSSELLDWTTFMALNASPEATIECVHAFGRTDMRNDLKNIDVPTLIIHGKDDKTVPIEVSGEEAANGIMDAVARFYSGAPHGLFVTHKEQLYSDIISFIDGSLQKSGRDSTAPLYHDAQINQ